MRPKMLSCAACLFLVACATRSLEVGDYPRQVWPDPARYWAKRSAQQNFEQVDAGDEDSLNRILWHAMKGTGVPYPAHQAGAHGRGLRELGIETFVDINED